MKKQTRYNNKNIKTQQGSGLWGSSKKKKIPKENTSKKLKDVTKKSRNQIFKHRVQMQTNINTKIQKLADDIAKLSPDLKKKAEEIKKASTKTTRDFESHLKRNNPRGIMSQKDRVIIAKLAYSQKQQMGEKYAYKSTSRDSLVREIVSKFDTESGDAKRKTLISGSSSSFSSSRKFW